MRDAQLKLEFMYPPLDEETRALRAKVIMAMIEQGFEVRTGLPELDRMIKEYQECLNNEE